MTREDIHEAAKNDDTDGQKPSEGTAVSEAGGGFGTPETNLDGADAVPEKTTGTNDPQLDQSAH